ncbi:MAG: ABC transporter permease, partial [Bacteroidetes bacterium]|nr:ABC transporter permease [Bacteroidota bacterium]
MNFLFAWRYFKAEKSTTAINIIAWVSVIAIGFGTAALILSLSVFNGFEDLVKSLYSDFYTDLRIIPANGKIIRLSPQQQQAIARWPGVKKLAMTVEEKALVQNGDYQSSLLYIKGVDNGWEETNSVAARMVRGKFHIGDAARPLAVLGVGVESALGLESDRAILPLTVYLPKKGLNADMTDPLQSLSTGNVATSGSFAIQQDFDNNYIITNIGFVKQMLNLGPDEYGAGEIAIDRPGEEEKVRRGLQGLLGSDYIVQTRYEQNRSLYSTMRTEKWFIFILLSFIVVLAAFTMIGALTMLVLEKQKDIQILKAMGSNNAAIQKIFLSEGVLLGIIGGGGGTLLALVIGW